jgi:lipid-A-disaccharide synthase
VAIELLRAFVQLALVPLFLLRHFLDAKTRSREVLGYLGTSAEPTPVPATRPLVGARVFLSCAEASGEIHARTLVLRTPARLGEVAYVGLCSPALEQLGVRAIGDPVSQARMGFGVVGALPFYLRLLTDAARVLRDERPDAALFVDSPALHVPLGRLARRYGVPVVHLVTPQYWAWAPWRVRGYRKAVDLGLSILPFEVPWFAARDVRAAHVGHPLQDRLMDVPRLDAPCEDGPLALLPGSRVSVVRRNLPWMLARLAEAPPGSALATVHAVIAVGRADLAEFARECVRSAGLEARVDVEQGDLHRVLPRCRAAFAVSGTVLLDVLHHRLPMVVVYHLPGRLEDALSRRLLTVPHVAIVNLLAGRGVVPEYSFHGVGPTAAVSADLEALLVPGAARDAQHAGLELAAARLGGPGAIDRTLGWLATLVEGPGAGAQGDTAAPRAAESRPAVNMAARRQ